MLRENEQKYNEKWKQGDGILTEENKEITQSKDSSPCPSNTCPLPRSPRPKFLTDIANDGALLLKENPIHLSACLIVRDNETTIRPCLETLSPWVDEVVVVDTGSKDRTPDICEELGARVYHWPWCDDFAAARNESLRYARGEWIFWMDSDDTLPEQCGQQLKELARREHQPNTLGYVMQVHCPGQESTDVTVVDHIKLFRNRPDLNFEFRIHEQILPSIRRAGGEVEFTDIHVIHSGATKDAAGRTQKLRRDFRLLHLENQDRPNHPFTLFNLGMTHADCGQHQEAIEALNHCIQVSGKEESHLRKAYALLVSAQTASGAMEDALSTSESGLMLFQDDPELLFRRAMVLHQVGRLEDAVNDYQRILELEPEQKFSSLDIGILGYKARHNLAVVYVAQKRLVAAEVEFREAVRQRPNYAAAHANLAAALLASGRASEAVESYERAAALGELSPPARQGYAQALAAIE